MNFENLKADMCGGHPREILETDKCDWCQDKKAVILYGYHYVFCSEECKELFIENCHQAVDEVLAEQSRDMMKRFEKENELIYWINKQSTDGHLDSLYISNAEELCEEIGLNFEEAMEKYEGVNSTWTEC
jgi:hypothetical protein